MPAGQLLHMSVVSLTLGQFGRVGRVKLTKIGFSAHPKVSSWHRETGFDSRAM